MCSVRVDGWVSVHQETVIYPRYLLSLHDYILFSTPILATAEQEEDQCKFEGCTRPKYEEGSIKYDYCSKEHAKRDGELFLKCTW